MAPRTWFGFVYGYTLAPQEAATARHGFTAFGYVLASYFILLPLREDVALTLGPSVLPSLFTASLVVTAIVSPLVTAYIVNPSASASRAHGFRRLCRLMAGCLVGLWALLLLTSPDPWVILRLLRLLRPLNGGAPELGGAAEALLSPPPPVSERLGWYGKAVRVCFYVYLSLQSLLSTSTMWAVCADTFTAATSTRVYGFLGAGATLGQLLASAAAFVFGAACKRTGAAGASVWLLLPAAGMLLLATRACQAMSARADAVTVMSYAEGGDGLEARNSGGGGGGGSGDGGGGTESGGGGGPWAPPGSGPGSKPGSLSGSGGVTARGFWRTPAAAAGSGSGAGGGGWLQRLPRAALASHASRLSEGFSLIAASPYLLAACAFLALNYSTSATLYFLRAAIVSRAGWLADSDQRIAFFAALNTASAGVIFVAQMTLTGRVLTSLGVGPTLLVGPLVSLAGMAVVGAYPSPANIAGVEVVRKVVQYSLARPCREVLFTVVSRREKYAAKVVLDTVVQRAGDTAAAALFELLAVRMSLGPPAVAAAGLALCGGHIAVAAALGRMYGTRRAAAALADKQQHQLHDL